MDKGQGNGPTLEGFEPHELVRSVKAIAIIIKRQLRPKDSNYLSEKSPLSMGQRKKQHKTLYFNVVRFIWKMVTKLNNLVKYVKRQD